jgi:DNA-directed RNA polymerase subunit RPC12/RpoP
MAIAPRRRLLFPTDRRRGGRALDTATGTFVADYFCPVCGIELERSDFDKAPEDYHCPFCSSRQTPSRATRRAGWEIPD